MRAYILETIYEWSKKPYQKWFKKNAAWSIPAGQLLLYPTESLGFHLGCFLLKYNFDPQPKLENHDVFHVLTNIGITVPEEIAMQFYLFGNGKRSLYLLAVIFLGTLLYPDNIQLFRKAYKKGQEAYAFHQLDYQKLLDQPILKIQNTFLITPLWK
ncbi:Coq4 family protein [Aquimarina gracilis]|uniref:Coq4 family protein n=1 Tax=Aquimarina gracilis TaxID=874422 RepID=A0ABU5ZY48_9FLAO|nr:Coq4 family protein [Aquimarina gracilis]MEB3346809.1 Coq4 family protein [Aquimarina gracilis]